MTSRQIAKVRLRDTADLERSIAFANAAKGGAAESRRTLAPISDLPKLRAEKFGPLIRQRRW
jgi:hypothetical protein